MDIAHLCVTIAVLTAPPGPASLTRPDASLPLLSAPAAQQQPVQAPEPIGFIPAFVTNLVDDVKHIPRRNTIYWLAGGAAMTAAVHPADKTLNRHLVGSDLADTISKPGHIIGSTPFQMGASAALYIVGVARHHPRVRHLAMDLLEAQVLSEGITEGLKYTVRRERPDGTGYGFPSGHAAITFATATVLQQHLGWKASVPTFLIATYVSLTRLHDNRHYVSDVMAGATEGIIIGRAVTWHGRNSWQVVPSGDSHQFAVYLVHH
ncbi:MAG TPA: phosphatase PAP2 family protein [Vicinamibacterales bacterium]|nr:phosphatase PAP2 family protein [Vicinamibacterales bacterium]